MVIHQPTRLGVRSSLDHVYLFDHCRWTVTHLLSSRWCWVADILLLGRREKRCFPRGPWLRHYCSGQQYSAALFNIHTHINTLVIISIIKLISLSNDIIRRATSSVGGSLDPPLEKARKHLHVKTSTATRWHGIMSRQLVDFAFYFC